MKINSDIPKNRISKLNIRFSQHTNKEHIGWASCVFDNCLYLNNISIKKKKSGEIFLIFPGGQKSGHGRRTSYFHPISQDITIEFTSAVKKQLIGNGW